MAQKLTAKQVDEKLDMAAEKLRPVAYALRDAIDALNADLTAISAWSFVCYCGTDRVFSIIPYTKHVNLQLWHGAEMEDETGLIDGVGKRLRHVKCRTVDDVNRPELKALMVAAIAYDKTLESGVKI